MTSPFRIAIMMTGSGGWAGGTEYTKNLVLALGRLPTDKRKTFELSLIVDKEPDGELKSQLSSYVDRIHLTSSVAPALTFYNRVRWALLSRLFKFNDIIFYDFLQQEFDFVYPFLNWHRGLKDVPCATWIPDFQHKYLKHFFTDTEIATRDENFEKLATFAKVLVLSSNSAAEDFRTFYPHALAPARILRFRSVPDPHWFSQDPEETQKKYNLPDRFFIVSNQVWQHKNHLTVFNALKLLQEKGIKPVVVCTGHIYDNRQPGFSDTILQTIHLLGLSDHVKLLGLIPRRDQIQLMRRSVAVIQPSLFEGWSTVVEDARVLGKSMILSDFAVHLEQAPPGARYFAKESPEELAQLLDECWHVLPAGPDCEREAVARENNREELNEFARTFLQIARGE